MTIAINKKVVPNIVADAYASGLITAESSSTVAVYQISRYWRELFQTATRYRSENLPQWSEKEVSAAKVITSALLFLAMEKCRNVEALIAQVAGDDSLSNEIPPAPKAKQQKDSPEPKAYRLKNAHLSAELTETKAELNQMRRRVKALHNEVRRLRRQPPQGYPKVK